MNKLEFAMKLRSEGCNCAQAVVCVFAEECGIDINTAYRLSEGLGGGIGNLKSFCGAPNGMAIVVGLLNSKGIESKGESKKETCDTVKKLVKKFEAKNGSYICSELKAFNTPVRPCHELINDCIMLLEDYMEEKR